MIERFYLFRLKNASFTNLEPIPKFHSYVLFNFLYFAINNETTVPAYQSPSLPKTSYSVRAIKKASYFISVFTRKRQKHENAPRIVKNLKTSVSVSIEPAAGLKRANTGLSKLWIFVYFVCLSQVTGRYLRYHRLHGLNINQLSGGSNGELQRSG